MPDIPTYKTQSVLMVIFCCLPMGVTCIMKANKVGKLKAAGDYPEALNASNENRKMLWIGFGLGLAANVLYFAAQLSKTS